MRSYTSFQMLQPLQDYVAAFRPLLLDECAALLLREGGLEEATGPVPCTPNEKPEEVRFFRILAQLQADDFAGDDTS